MPSFANLVVIVGAGSAALLLAALVALAVAVAAVVRGAERSMRIQAGLLRPQDIDAFHHAAYGAVYALPEGGSR